MPDADTNFNIIINRNNNIVFVNFIFISDDLRFTDLINMQRYWLIKLEAEKQVIVEKFRFVELQNVREYRREYSDNHYRDTSRKRISVIKVLKI